MPSPVTPADIEVTFLRGSDGEALEVQLMQGTAEEAAGWPAAFRTHSGL